MKKVLCSLLVMSFGSVALSTTAFAGETENQFVQQLYSHARSIESGNKALELFSGGKLKQGLLLDAKYSAKYGESCGEIDSDIVWGNQDPDMSAKVTTTSKGNWVTASFKQYGKKQNVRYKVECSGEQCQIVDVAGSGMTSLANVLLQSCR